GAVQPRRDDPLPRRDGKVHLLRAAHQRRQDRRAPLRHRGDQGRHDHDLLPAGVPAAGHHVRGSQRSQEQGRPAQGRRALLRAARGDQRPAAHDVSGADPQPEPGDGVAMADAESTAPQEEVLSTSLEQPSTRAPLVLKAKDLHEITDNVAVIVEAKTPKPWLFITALTGSLLLIMLGSLTKLVLTGLGLWGINNTIAWAWDITGFVFWIGIGHAGTLISAILYLLRQRWRTSINRAAEAMTLFAVLAALIYPTFHVGRVWFLYWVFPIPNQMSIWPNFRSPLLWDVF